MVGLARGGRLTKTGVLLLRTLWKREYCWYSVSYMTRGARKICRNIESQFRTILFGESLKGNRIGATGLRASERKSASEKVSERVSEREGFQRFLRF